MAKPRIELQKLFEETIKSKNVYYNPPSNLKLKYSCLVYFLNPSEDMYADDLHYIRNKCYLATYITRDPDDPIIEELSNLPLCAFERAYSSDNLYHAVFKIYF